MSVYRPTHDTVSRMIAMTNPPPQKRWRRLPWSDADAAAAEALARELRIHPVVARLMIRRGQRTPAAAQAFLTPRLTDLHDPELLPGITKAAQRIEQAVQSHQPIVIYGDYDVDGITASAILWNTLNLAGANVSTYVPHRIEEGYGLNNEAITSLCQGRETDGVKPLIISVDCGITAVQPAAIAKAAGVDLIVTDHHHLDPDALPNAFALVHPDLPGSTYPFRGLCGAGVAFKLAWHFARVHCGGVQKLPLTFRTLLLDLVSLAALGTVADVVPLLEENRVITAIGLGQIKRTKFIGLNALIDASDLRAEKIDAYHVGFVLGPRINACGRMGHAKQAVHLLTRAQPNESVQIAEFLTQENERRRATERAIFLEAKEMVESHGFHHDSRRAIVVGKEGWHQGVIGIVASRLVDNYSRPAIVLTFGEAGANGEAEAHGSARSVDGISIHEALQSCAALFTSFGGHAMAAGMRLPVSRVESLRQAIIDFINPRLSIDELTPVVTIEAECELTDLTSELMTQLQKIEPCGRDNETPVFCVRGAVVDRHAMRMGSEGRHLSVQLRKGRAAMRAVGWHMGHLAEQLVAGVTIDAAFVPRTSEWNGQRRIELMLEDIVVTR